MPARPTSTQNLRLNNLTACLTVAANTLGILAGSIETPFLKAIATTAQSLVKFGETGRQNKDEYVHLMEQTHQLLNAIIILHLQSDGGSELSPNTLRGLGKFTETLHKIHTFIEAQQNRNKIQQFFRQSEMNALLMDCKAGLQQALEVFEVQALSLMTDAKEMQQAAEDRHQEVLEMIASLSDSDQASSVRRLSVSGGSCNNSLQIGRVYHGSYNSSNSISVLPSEPKIFHGRESEMTEILQHFRRGTPRIAILGAGGMGKTSLARTVLHHTEIAARYDQHRYFVTCDSATNQVELAALIGSHLGLKPGKNLTRLVINHFSSAPPGLLILDNLEMLWEPLESRKEIEEFLSLLTDVNHLAVVITMRGAERPIKVSWTRPFLQPLKPLVQDAARETFFDIADDGHDMDEVDQILNLTDNMPLAIHLMAHLVDIEGCSNVLSSWEQKKTSLVSEGYDRTSNLEISIALSLASPRITALPQCQDLLSLLAILPDGISDLDLLQSQLLIPDILGCKLALLRTSLAYYDEHKRLKALVPIREYMLKVRPPGDELVRPLLGHFQELLKLFTEFRGSQSSSGIIERISSNYSNSQSVIRHGLEPACRADLKDIIYCTLKLNTFSLLTGRGPIPLLDKIPNFLPRPCDNRVEAHYITEIFYSCSHHPISNPEALIAQALDHFQYFEDPDIKCRFHNGLAHYYIQHKHDLAAAQNVCQTALSLSISAGSTRGQRETLHNLAWIKWKLGDHAAVEQYATQSLRLARMAADLWKEAQALHILAMCSTTRGDYKHSISLSTRARKLLGLCGMAGGGLDHSIMNSLAVVHSSKSEYIEARDIRTRILEQVSLETDPYIHALASQSIAQIDLHIGAPRNTIQEKIDVARSIFNNVGHAGLAIECDILQAKLDLREGDLLGASTLLQKTLTVSWGKDSGNVADCLEALGDIERWGKIGSKPAWTNWTTLFLVHSLKMKKPLNILRALQCLGDVCVREGDEETAVVLFTVAMEGFTLMDIHRGRADCMRRLGDTWKRRGDMGQALELWQAARPLFERSSQVNRVKEIEERLANNAIEVGKHAEPDLDRVVG